MDNIDRLYNKKFLEYDKYEIEVLNIHYLHNRILSRLIKIVLSLIVIVLLISLLFTTFISVSSDTDSFQLAIILTSAMLIFFTWIAIKSDTSIRRLGNRIDGILSKFAKIQFNVDGFYYNDTHYSWDKIEFTPEFENRNISNIKKSMISTVSADITYNKEEIIIIYEGMKLAIIPKSIYEYHKLIDGFLYFYFYKRYNKKF